MANSVEKQEAVKDVFEAIQLKSIMMSEPVTIAADEPFYKIVEKFRKHGIKHLLVVDEAQKLVGLITMQEINLIYSPKLQEDNTFRYDKDKVDQFSLKQTMTKNISTCQEEDTLVSAIEKMGGLGFGCIPIVDKDNKPTGIITQSDILRTIDALIK